jgi:putative ABC transport system permease protein
MKPRMNFGENTRMALNTLWDHKVRSVLTVLGVVVAVTIVIAVGSIMVCIDREFQAALSEFGTDSVIIFKFKPGIHIGRLSQEERSRKSLTLEDTMALRELCPAVQEVTAERFPRIGQGPVGVDSARYKSHEVLGVRYTGVLPSYERVRNALVGEGRFFTESEDLHRADVTVVGKELAETLFPAGDALGHEILVSGISYRIVGVLDKARGSFIRGDTADKRVLVPYRTYAKHHPRNDEIAITARAFPGMISVAEDQIRGVLRQRRHVPYDKPDNFGMSTAEEISEQFRQITSSVALLTLALVSVGLLIGGVGVMNIMLMSVTERTREIGVRKAIGARRRDIIAQFLTEAVTLSLLGGMTGVLIGFFISLGINAVLPSAVPFWAVLVGVGAAMSVGVFFGMYPAVKASRLDPVDALRYE